MRSCVLAYALAWVTALERVHGAPMPLRVRHQPNKETYAMEKKTVNKLSRFAPSLTIHNDTGETLPLALLSILKRARRGAVEVELYGDGSGLEVACMGRVFILGVEAKPCAVCPA